MLDTLKRWFPKNVDGGERGKRIIVGTSVLLLFFFPPQTPLALIGLYPIITGLIGRCVISKWMGMEPLEAEPTAAQLAATTAGAVTAAPAAPQSRSAA